MAQRPRTNSAASDSSNKSDASVRDGFAEDNLNALKAEEKERPIGLRDTKLAILNANQFHWRAQNIWQRHLSPKQPSNEPQYSVKARLFLVRLNATAWEERSCLALQFISDCFRQLHPDC